MVRAVDRQVQDGAAVPPSQQPPPASTSAAAAHAALSSRPAACPPQPLPPVTAGAPITTRADFERVVRAMFSEESLHGVSFDECTTPSSRHSLINTLVTQLKIGDLQHFFNNRATFSELPPHVTVLENVAQITDLPLLQLNTLVKAYRDLLGDDLPVRAKIGTTVSQFFKQFFSTLAISRETTKAVPGTTTSTPHNQAADLLALQTLLRACDVSDTSRRDRALAAISRCQHLKTGMVLPFGPDGLIVVKSTTPFQNGYSVSTLQIVGSTDNLVVCHGPSREDRENYIAAAKSTGITDAVKAGRYQDVLESEHCLFVGDGNGGRLASLLAARHLKRNNVNSVTLVTDNTVGLSAQGLGQFNADLGEAKTSTLHIRHHRDVKNVSHTIGQGRAGSMCPHFNVNLKLLNWESDDVPVAQAWDRYEVLQRLLAAERAYDAATASQSYLENRRAHLWQKLLQLIDADTTKIGRLKSQGLPETYELSSTLLANWDSHENATLRSDFEAIMGTEELAKQVLEAWVKFKQADEANTGANKVVPDTGFDPEAPLKALEQAYDRCEISDQWYERELAPTRSSVFWTSYPSKAPLPTPASELIRAYMPPEEPATQPPREFSPVVDSEDEDDAPQPSVAQPPHAPPPALEPQREFSPVIDSDDDEDDAPPPPPGALPTHAPPADPSDTADGPPPALGPPSARSPVEDSDDEGDDPAARPTHLPPPSPVTDPHR